MFHAYFIFLTVFFYKFPTLVVGGWEGGGDLAGEGIQTGFDEGWRDEQLIFVMQNQTNKGKKGEMEGGPLRCKAWPYLYSHF